MAKKKKDSESRATTAETPRRPGVIRIDGEALPADVPIVDKPFPLNYWWEKKGRR